MTANLQPRMTVKQVAAAFNVSERAIYMAKKVQRCSPELSAEVRAGRMSLAEAHRLVTQAPKPTAWDRLLRAWNAASEEDRKRLLALAGQAGSKTKAECS